MAGQSKVPRSVVGPLITALLESGAKRATKYMGTRLVVRATRKTYRVDDYKIDHRDRAVNIVVTIGPPNYEDRQFIKACFKAGESLPVRKIQFKYPPKRRKPKAKRKRGRKR